MRRVLQQIRAEHRATSLLLFAVERAVARGVRPGPLFRFIGLVDHALPNTGRPKPAAIPSICGVHAPAPRHGHGWAMSPRGSDVLSSMESAYLEDEPIDRLLEQLHHLISLDARHPAWRPYSVAVRGRVLADALRDGLDDDAARRFALLHLTLLTLRSERHLSNNHRTTIELAKVRLSEELGFGAMTTRRLDAFGVHARRAIGPNGFPHEGSVSYARGLAAELSIAEEAGFDDRSLAPRIREAVSAVAYSDGTAPLFGDTFPERAIVPPSLPPRWEAIGRIIRARSDAFELAVSLGSQGPRGFGGHGHLDRGAFELFHRDAGLLIADPGCTTYGSSVTRGFERSYLAHNMATPAWGLAQQPTWGSFAYRRIRCADVQEIIPDANRLRIVLEVDQETRSGSDTVRLIRTFDLDDQGLTITDAVHGRSPLRPILRTFLAAETATVETTGPTVIRPVRAGTRFVLSLRSDCDWRQVRETFDAGEIAAHREFSARIELAPALVDRSAAVLVTACPRSKVRF